MTFASQLKATDSKLLPAELSGKRPRLKTSSILAGPKGLRAGWRLLIFFALLAVPAAGLLALAHARGGRSEQVTITPMLLGTNDAIVFLILCCAVAIMGKLERRGFSEYGLPWRNIFGKNLWVGALYGFLAISGTLLAMFLLHGFRVKGLAIHGAAIFPSLTAWGMAFLLVGLLEEFAFRGYVQYTLASGIGFWPAAFVMSGMFGLAHFLLDPSETVAGSVAVVMFGLLLCLFLRRTGNLWCAVGFHLGYDWGQMFYGVPDSGIVPYHNLLHSTFNGPRWLTGGMVGPEASVLTPIALVIAGLIFIRFYRKDCDQLPRQIASPVTAS